MCNCPECHESCRCLCHAFGRGLQLMVVEHSSLDPVTRDRLRRVELLRSNADGARHMAARFDADADAINTKIEGAGA